MSFRYAVKELLIRKHRTVVNCIGIAVAVALVISLYSLSNAYKEAVRKPFEASGVDLVVQRPKSQATGGAKATGVTLPDSAAPITDAELQSLTGIDGISDISACLQIWSFDKGNFKVVVGIEPNSPDIGMARFQNWVNSGRFFDSDETDVAVVEKHFAKASQLKVGDTVEISGEKFEIIGTVEVKEGSQLSAPNMFLPINEVRRLAGTNENDVNAIYIRLDQAAKISDITGKISNAITGAEVSSPDSSLSAADSLLSLAQQFTWLISIIIILVAAFLIFKTVSSNVFERIKEMGIMKAVGWTSNNIRRQLTLEMIVQGALGGVLGVVFGIAVSFGLTLFKINAPLPWQGSPLPGSAGTAAGDNPLVALEINISPLFIAATVAVTLLITVVCGIIASNRTVRITPAEALRKI